MARLNCVFARAWILCPSGPERPKIGGLAWVGLGQSEFYVERDIHISYIDR